MGGDNVITVQDHVPDALAVRPVLRRLHPQSFPEAIIPLAEGGDKDDVALVHDTRRMAGLAEPDVLHKTLGLPHAHGRIHDAERNWLFVIGISVNNQSTSCFEDAVLAGNVCRPQRKRMPPSTEHCISLKK